MAAYSRKGSGDRNTKRKNQPPSTPSKPKKDNQAPPPKFSPIKCKVCKKECLSSESFTSEDDNSINCDICNLWFHKPCIDTSTAEWEALNGGNENITYRCDDCVKNKGHNANQVQIFKQLLIENNDILFQRLASFESKILQKVDEKIDKKMEEFEEKNEKLIESKIKEHHEKVNNNKDNEQSIECTIKEHVTQKLDELKERDERKCNLMLFNIKESTKSEMKEEISDDLLSVMQVIKHTNPDLKETITNQITENNIKRLGKKSQNPPDDNNKPRPIKLTLPDEPTKFKILKNSFKLRSYPQNNKIGLKPDLTKQQQYEERELRKELSRRKELKEDVMIFRGKVINRADHEKLKKEFASKDPTAPNKGQY